MEKQIVDFALLIDINPNNERSEFIWLIDQGLSKPMPGWVYRADPNGKWHYYTETSGTQGLEKQQSSSSKRNGNGKGEISGWEADMNASLAQDDKRQTSNSTSISRNIQSVWTHPRVKFYKNLHKKLRKKRRLENREELASKLLKESTDDHIRRKHRGRQSGGVPGRLTVGKPIVVKDTLLIDDSETYFGKISDIVTYDTNEKIDKYI